jgi:glycosyltransferase involved in cell wall biosynthesis
MKILLMGRDFGIGGGTTFRLHLAGGLIGRGHEVWVAGQPGPMVRSFAEAGAHPVKVLPSPFCRMQLRRLLHHRAIDIMHASNVGRGDDAAYLREQTGKPFVLSIHGLLAPSEIRRRCLSLAPRLIAFDEAVFECLKRVPSVDPRRVVHARLPFPRRSDIEIPADGTFPVVVIGRLSRRKSQIALHVIEAFERFHARVPVARLTVIGGGSQTARVRQAGREANRRLGQAPIQVVGALADPWPYLRGAAVVIGGGYAALESLLQGKGIIGAGFLGFGAVTADNVRQADAVNFGDAGGEWEPTPEALLAALHELHAGFTDPALRGRYYHLDRILGEEHSVERVVAEIERLYEAVIRQDPVGD